VNFKPGLFTDDGEVTDESTAAFLREFMQEFRDHTERVLTVLPRG
jgi:chromate reductase